MSVLIINTFLLMSLICYGYSNTDKESKYIESNYEDMFYCIDDKGAKSETEERILILSPEDYYFIKKIKLHKMMGKVVPKDVNKTFANAITVSGFLNTESGIHIAFLTNRVNL